MMNSEFVLWLETVLVRNGVDRRLIDPDFIVNHTASAAGVAGYLRELVRHFETDLTEEVRAHLHWDTPQEVVHNLVADAMRGRLRFEFDIEDALGVKRESFLRIHQARHLTEMSKALSRFRVIAFSSAVEAAMRVILGEEQDDLYPVPGIYVRLSELLDYENGEASDLEFDAAMRAAFTEEGGDPDDKGAYQEWLETNSGEDYYDIVRYYGDWKLNDDGLLEPDKDGPDGFAASDAGDYYVRVHWSREWAIGRWCAPTFPGQADGRITDGHILPGDERVEDLCVYYALPRDILDRVIEY